MDKLRIQGPTRLEGTVDASGAKNAALPILAACLLTDEPVTLHRLPAVRDIRTMLALLGHLGIENRPADRSSAKPRPRSASTWILRAMVF